jgi:hypothetical protein
MQRQPSWSMHRSGDAAPMDRPAAGPASVPVSQSRRRPAVERAADPFGGVPPVRPERYPLDRPEPYCRSGRSRTAGPAGAVPAGSPVAEIRPPAGSPVGEIRFGPRLDRLLDQAVARDPGVRRHPADHRPLAGDLDDRDPADRPVREPARVVGQPMILRTPALDGGPEPCQRRRARRSCRARLEGRAAVSMAPRLVTVTLVLACGDTVVPGGHHVVEKHRGTPRDGARLIHGVPERTTEPGNPTRAVRSSGDHGNRGTATEAGEPPSDRLSRRPRAGSHRQPLRRSPGWRSRSGRARRRAPRWRGARRSRWAVASSRTTMSSALSSRRSNAIRCFSPPEGGTRREHSSSRQGP